MPILVITPCSGESLTVQELRYRVQALVVRLTGIYDAVDLGALWLDRLLREGCLRFCYGDEGAAQVDAKRVTGEDLSLDPGSARGVGDFRVVIDHHVFR